MGQAHARAYMSTIYEQLVNGKINPSEMITHKLPLDDATKGYQMFQNKEDQCIKVVLKP